MITHVEDLLTTVEAAIRAFADIAVVAMSGGADSTLTALLAARALGPERVYTLHLPYGARDQETFNARSWRTAERLGVHRQRIPIGRAADALTDLLCIGLGGGPLSPVNAGNARARVRMALLYGWAHEVAGRTGQRVRVLGTGNRSEDFIGYDTKGGDALADLFPIGSLYKSEVYQLLDHFRDSGVIAEDMIDRTPSAGLWEGQTDEGELGHSYDAMEQAIRQLTGEAVQRSPDNALCQFVAARHRAHVHKHEAPPVVALRSFCD